MEDYGVPGLHVTAFLQKTKIGEGVSDLNGKFMIFVPQNLLTPEEQTFEIQSYDRRWLYNASTSSLVKPAGATQI